MIGKIKIIMSGTVVSGIVVAATALSSAVYTQAQAPVIRPPAAAPAAPAPAAPVAPPAPFDTALLNAANTLFSKAQLPAGDAKVELVIDPLIDGVSGAQSAASRLMEKRLIELVQKSYPRFAVRPFTTDALERAPVVLVGTFTAINNAGEANGARDAYRICLALADLRSKTIISKGFAKALPDGVDATPTPAFADNPVWAEDEATVAYIKTCQGTKAGDPLNPVYVDRIGTASLISDGVVEYDNKRYREALAFYRTAKRMPGGDQLRVHNGVYLSNWKLSRREDASQSFADLVSFGLKSNKLAVRFLFRPGSTQFFGDEQLTAPYPMWLQQIAAQAARTNSCLEIVGHTSATGPAQLNERLSVLRAESIKSILEQSDRGLVGKLIATGAGPRENLIGTAKDDASDALDRRVEFKVLKC
jgi:outer membrane protein OmpA-like peptidoglycan-associated protein